MTQTLNPENYKTRKKYQNLEILVQIIYHESSIAAGSAKVAVGNAGNSHSPFIEDWDEGGTRSSDFEM